MLSAVFYEAFEEEERILRNVLPKEFKYLFTWKTIQESGHEVPPAKIISTRTQSRFPVEWADKLTAIITRSTGYDHVADYLLQTRASVAAAYLPEYAARPVAEQALMMWTALLRNLTVQRKSFETFHRDGLTGREIRKRRITVIGVGRIGEEIVDIAHGLKMKILGIDIKPRTEMEKQYGLKYVSLKEGLENADIAVCALPLTELTRGMLNYKTLKAMPGNSIFINVGRGEVSPSQDLLKLSDEGILAGIGLDVYDFEKELASVLRDGTDLSKLKPEARKSVAAVLKLMKNQNVILTPHNAFNTEESVERKSLRTAENLAAFLKTGKFLTPIIIR
ncbi:MAG: NAD(P)-dependent oxidoreductase [Lentisphaerota bacterium]